MCTVQRTPRDHSEIFTPASSLDPALGTLVTSPDGWYRSVVVSDRRVLMAMTVDHVYGATVR
jgi:hypothetical protein